MAKCLRCGAGGEWLTGNVRKEGVRLTAKEAEMVLRAINFAKAGEWPWDPVKSSEIDALNRAYEKLEGA